MGAPRSDRLLALLPELEATTDRTSEGSEPPPEVGGLVAELSRVAHEDGCIIAFDWGAWKRELTGPFEAASIDTADLELCRKVLTVIVRQDRFVENSLAGHVRSGFVARLVRRIKELQEASDGA